MSRSWLLELGNSRLKVAAARGGNRLGTVESMPAAAFDDWMAANAAPGDDRFWLAAVAPAPVTDQVTAALDRIDANRQRVTTGSVALPVAPAYPELGVDRWLAMQPVWHAVRAPFLLVDAGTATTIDVVDGLGRHLGGWILPGLAASRAGLIAAAPGLARVAREADADPGPAQDTAQAVERGLRLQQIGAIERALVEVRTSLPGAEPDLVLTGGAAASLQSGLGHGRLVPDLVLKGLAMVVERW